jgi:hypothetical protein
MYTLRIFPLIALLAAACGASDSDPMTDTTDAPATTGGSAPTTEDGTSTTEAATHDHATHDHDPTTGHATTGHATTDHATTDHATTDHATTDHATDSHGTDSHGTAETGTTDGSDLSGDYCACMLVNCHDQYHGTWGEDHTESELMCLAAADAVPSVGAPAMSGDSIECRIHFCELGHDDPTACDAALGGAPCVD